MARNANTLSHRLRNLDAYAKTLDDFSIKTISGATVTLISAAIILTLLLSEFMDYCSVDLRPELTVDKTRGEKMTINLNITFPHAPCFLLNLDVMDATGEQQVSVDHDIYKVRLDTLGNPIDEMRETHRAATQADGQGTAANTPAVPYCGSCYGGTSPSGGKCCNTCDDVRRAYSALGWAFANPDDFEQCVREHWKENLAKQNKEGCTIHGFIEVNKVSGNFHIMAGQSALHNNIHIHAIYSYMPEDYDFTHTINHLSFGTKYPNMVNPLDGAGKVAPVRDLQYQYFLKVVGTEIHYLSQPSIISNQYSVTEHAKQMVSGFLSQGNTGLFFNFEISPMRVIYTEHRKSLSHFLTSLCAIVGGIFTVAGIVDAFIYRAENVIRQKVELGKQL
ncbi:endoplasmic reticulum-golgi intermediate compartment protein 3 [Dimargaris cristalligena]|uniref:Endoplasmic reticulum-golgi intermediate compartment protein 3 n=1 Tax=Dimargaris cristalligena TaxID=215637 RepID=A0A4V1J538_9FUNG|nr:endoplasmic reticulum-golgi intermediate compartment protein 3 [Dimargaris cristalligena]|eukprot:RKP37709.1 endoplasmic reticulum-golgi intermediate compartment protein 3 [Dimargaris cristalligena]